MKKMILSLTTALLGCTAFAANCVSVKQISTDYINHQITIAITRNGCTGDATNHRNTVWVFVDYREAGGSSWTRATISATSSGTVVNSGNSKGAWINGASGTQTVTLTLSGMPAKYDWCAFASDYPPNVAAAGGVFTFRGTPPFVLQPKTGTAQTVTQTTLAATALTVVPVSIMDATGCPGIFCPYTGTDLFIDATHICQLRTGGAKNWEAWIEDARDNKRYRIAQLSTGLWTMDDYLNYKGHPAVVAEKCSAADPGATEYWRYLIYNNSSTPLCPAGWRLPTQSEYELTVNSWTQYLSKVYQNTGETVYHYGGGGYVCQANYLSFIVSNCLQLSSYGQRSTSINPVTYSGGQNACYSYIGQTSGVQHCRYSGYVRCVRE